MKEPKQVRPYQPVQRKELCHEAQNRGYSAIRHRCGRWSHAALAFRREGAACLSLYYLRRQSRLQADIQKH
jgi:hypothetical protein